MPAKKTPVKKRVATSGGGAKAFGKDLVRSAKNLNTKMGKKAKKLQTPAKESTMGTWKKKMKARKK
jgi:hypothetical protein